MKPKSIFMIVMITLALALSVANYYEQELIDYKDKMMEENKQYAGPVPQGYDLEHYRKTGETKLIENG